MSALCKRRNRSRGNALIEVALSWVILTPLLIGSVGIGLSLGRAIQTSQVCRDGGHMYARGVDFSLTGNQNILVRIGRGLGLQLGTGSGVVTLTKVMFVGLAQCTDGGLTQAQCVNYHQTVILQRLRIGNDSLRASSYGTPPSAYLDSAGVAAAADYLTKPSLVVTNFASVLALGDGEVAYITEAYFNTQGQSFGMSDGTYARSFF